ncbi:beta-parvin-like [Mytilus trossulus]|uniref:beta-parvin-like n=1 Tax=Mytilus trossulus TaxID=6551 RepID=UPI003004AA54
MATSPNPATVGTPKKKDESFLDKIGTIGRKKKAKEVNILEEEGKMAIESPTSPTIPDVGPEGYLLDELEERSMIEPTSKEDPKVQELIKILLDWINDVLADDRIIVKDILEDLFDGQILQKLIEKLADIRVQVPEVTQSEQGQKQKLQIILSVINRLLQLQWNQVRWSVDKVHSKNLVAILHLLVTLARHYRAPIRMPDNVSVNLIVVTKRDGILQTKRVVEDITTINDDIGARFERDAFDTLFDHAPDKLNLVKKTLVTFVNKQLLKINFEVADLEAQFHDGVYLVLLMGLLEGYFVPLYDYHQTASTFDQKVHNVQFAFDLMQDAGLPRPKARPEDVVNQDLKSTLRVLYNIFTKYKGQGA